MPNEEGKDHNIPEGEEIDSRDRRCYYRVCRRESRRKDPWRGLFGGLLLIMLGIVFLLHQGGWLSGHLLWPSLAIAVGLVFIISGLARYLNPENHHHHYGKFIAGAVLILVGIFGLIGWSNWWPLILIAAGVIILFCLFMRREQIAGQ
jgi:hypothetical protein